MTFIYIKCKVSKTTRTLRSTKKIGRWETSKSNRNVLNQYGYGGSDDIRRDETNLTVLFYSNWTTEFVVFKNKYVKTSDLQALIPRSYQPKTTPGKRSNVSQWKVLHECIRRDLHSRSSGTPSTSSTSLPPIIPSRWRRRRIFRWLRYPNPEVGILE